jgi:hypothetical protein
MDSPEMSIIRQNALTNAREAVIGSGMHSSPHTAATKEERQQQLDAMAEDIIYLAYKFADFSSGRRESKAAAELVRLNPPGA